MGWKLNLGLGAGVVAASLIALVVFRNQIKGAFGQAGQTIGSGAGSFLGEIGSSFVTTLQSYLPGAGSPANIPSPGSPGAPTGHGTVLIPPPDIPPTPKTSTPPPTTAPAPKPPQAPSPPTTTPTPAPATPPPATGSKPKTTPAPGNTFGGLPGQYGVPIPGVNLIDKNAIHGSLNAYEYLLHEQGQQSSLQKPTQSFGNANIQSPSNDLFSQIQKALQGAGAFIPGLGQVSPIPRGAIIPEIA